MTFVNICSRIFDHCQTEPNQLALRIPIMQGQHYKGEESISYGDLAQQCAHMQSALKKLALNVGDRVLILAKPNINTYTLMLALFGLGIVPVLIDRGMSRERILASIRASRAKIAIGEQRILRLWWLFQPLWPLKRYAFDGKALGVKDLRTLYPLITPALTCALLPSKAHGLITFTSGSTGAPKGADRTHGSLIEQHLAIRAHGQDTPSDIDSPCFPVVVLHNLCCGISTVMPRVDLAAPANANGQLVIKHWRETGVTRISAAPAFMQAICTVALQSKQKLSHVRSVIVGGSTIPYSLALQLDEVFPQADIMLAYGSTEAEPIATISLKQLRTDWNTYAGHLVGVPVDEAQVCIVNSQALIDNEDDIIKAAVAVEDVGEILVSGAHVLHGYVDNPQADRESKIPRSNGTVWHKTGDAGFFDTQGRLWLVGRIKDALIIDQQTVYTFAPEKELDSLPNVKRSALIQHQQQVILILECDTAPSTPLLLTILNKHDIPQAQLALIDKIPVDGRHNSKVDRVKLKQLVAKNKLPLTLLSMQSIAA